MREGKTQARWIAAARRRPLVTGVMTLAFILVVASAWRPAPPATAADVYISNEQFSRYVETWSEPEGYFDTDNFISNETSYLHVIGDLKGRVQPGGVYIGVGPDQNFSYIAHTRPAMAVIVDIRRQNMLEHLVYKALFEMGQTRAEFVALLVGRKTPAVARNAPLPDILRAVRAAEAVPDMPAKLAEVLRSHFRDYGMKLSAEDLSRMRHVLDAFAQDGLDLRFSSFNRASSVSYPTFQSLLLETDRGGQLSGYLATDESFQWMRHFQMENRLVPIVGDFAGPKAFKNVASFLKANGLAVSVFYTSNVEFYIFGGDPWQKYLGNVRALPLNSDAVFIRAYFGNGQAHPKNVPGHRPTTLMHGIGSFLADEERGRIREYWDVVNR
jgi:hypothetical protein